MVNTAVIISQYVDMCVCVYMFVWSFILVRCSVSYTFVSASKNTCGTHVCWSWSPKEIAIL
jgi:hypothetical protein